MASGFAALAKSIKVPSRLGAGDRDKPHSYTNIMLGTSLLWFGWFGFNGGSAYGGNARAAMAILVTHVAACTAGLTWVFIAYWRHPERKMSSFHFCSGVVAGLVAITPASGFVRGYAAVIIGFVSGVMCHYTVVFKNKFYFDDTLDVFALHGMGGFIGSILTGVFASKNITFLDQTVIDGGLIDGNGMQVVYQLITSAATIAWAFGVTYAILWGMELLPLLRLRPEPEDELLGIDASQMGEFGGYEDLVEQIKLQTNLVDLQRGQAQTVSAF